MNILYLPLCFFMPSKQKLPAACWHTYMTSSPDPLVAHLPSVDTIRAPLAVPFMPLKLQISIN